MTERALFQKTLNGFTPASDEAQSFYERAKFGDIVELKATKVRNGRYHRLFFAILKLISDNSNPHLSTEQLLYFAKLATGTGQTISNPKHGHPEFIPGSISFARMDQQQFNEFVKTAITPLVSRFMHGTAPDDVIKQAMELAG